MRKKFTMMPPFGPSNTQKLQRTSPGKDTTANAAKGTSKDPNPKYDISTQDGKQMIRKAAIEGKEGKNAIYTTGNSFSDNPDTRKKQIEWRNKEIERLGGENAYHEKYGNAKKGKQTVAAVEAVEGEEAGEWKARITKQKTAIQSKSDSNKEYRNIKSTARKVKTNNIKTARGKYDPNNTLGPDGTSISFKQYMQANRKHEQQRKLNTQSKHLKQKSEIQEKQSGVGRTGDIMDVGVAGTVADMTGKEIDAMNANSDSTPKKENGVDYTKKYKTTFDKIKGLVKKKKKKKKDE